MAGLGGYLLRIITGALITAVSNTFTANSSAVGTITRFVCGAFMTITVLSPLADIELSAYGNYISSINFDAEKVVSEGVSVADEAYRNAIIQQTEELVMGKASSIGANIEISVFLSEVAPNAPAAIKISGTVSPYQRSVLSSYLSNDIGIPGACQEWN